MQSKNTYKNGTLHFIIYPTGEGTYVAACKDLCLIEEGKDAEMLRYRIMAHAKSFLLNVCKNDLGAHLLNQDLPKEILAEFNTYRAKKMNEDFQKWLTDIKKLINSKNVNFC